MNNYNFLSKEEFIDCINRGCEVEFLYNQRHFTLTHCNEGISIMEVCNENSEIIYNTSIALLNFIIDGKKLEKIITKIEVMDRTF